MNNWDTHNLSYFRRNHGLFWRGKLPGWVEFRPYLFPLLLIAFLLSCYGMVEANDARIAAELDADTSGRMLVDLANGGTIVGENFAAKCEHMVEVTN
jgi:hypothetical protein